MLAMIESMIKKALPDAIVEIKSDDEVHFELVVVSHAFNGLSRLKRQQLIYQALGDSVSSGKIHALAMKTYTPEQWSG